MIFGKQKNIVTAIFELGKSLDDLVENYNKAINETMIGQEYDDLQNYLIKKLLVFIFLF